MSLHIDFHRLDPRHIGHEVQHVANMGPEQLQRFVHDEFNHLVHEGATEIARMAFKESAAFARKLKTRMEQLRLEKPELTDAIDGVTITVNLSVITFTYDNFMHRAEGLCNLLDHQSQAFTFDRRSVKWVMENTGPSRIGLAVSGELFTSAISAGIGVDAPLALAVELVDMALEAAGVPE